MTLAETLLPKLSEWRPVGEGRHTWSLAVPSAGWSVSVVADRVETVGTISWELALTRAGAVPTGLTLQSWAERIATTATNLLEKLIVHEVDNAENVALLRSERPSVQGNIATYYEIVLKGLSHATLSRYQVDRSTRSPRSQTGFAITHESLARLAGDIAGA